MFKIITVVLLFVQISSSDECSEWFQKLKFKDPKSCKMIYFAAPANMSTFACPNECEKLCGETLESNNVYGLTDDEVEYCKKNKLNCLKAYKLTWASEAICTDVYPLSDTNDESDACRHYILAILLSRELGAIDAELILNAHENNPKEPKEEQAMDLANNRLGILDYGKSKEKFKSNEEIKSSFVKAMKSKNLVILKPKYSKAGGVPSEKP